MPDTTNPLKADIATRSARRGIDADTSPVPAYYALTAPPVTPSESLSGSHHADVVIVGGGLLGLSTALHLAERGIRAVVLEANEIGWGASGRAFGQVVPYFKHNPDPVLKHYGAELGEKLLYETGRGPDLVFSLIEKYGIACAPLRKGLIFAAHAPAGLAGLESRARYWQKRGAPVEMLDARDTEALIGTRYYAASLIDRRGGTINPLAYTRGMARAAAETGAVIYARSPVQQVKRAGNAWEVHTPSGKVVAKKVVLAGNAHTGRQLWPGLAKSIIPMRAHQLVSRTLSPELLQRILPQRQSMTDTRNLFSGLRLHPDGRLHASADGPVFDLAGTADVRKLDQRIEKLFPDAGRIEWEYRWTGWVAMTYDLFPHLHEPAPDLFAGFACSGRGLVHATMLGRDLAVRIARVPGEDPVFPLTSLRPSPLAPISQFLIGSLLTLYRAYDAVDDWRYHGRSG